MYLEALVIAEHLDNILFYQITQKYSKIMFEYDSLAIFPGNTQKFSCPTPPPPPRYNSSVAVPDPKFWNYIPYHLNTILSLYSFKWQLTNLCCMFVIDCQVGFVPPPATQLSGLFYHQLGVIPPPSRGYSTVNFYFFVNVIKKHTCLVEWYLNKNGSVFCRRSKKLTWLGLSCALNNTYNLYKS